ncbi:alpha/beta hydrolase [Patescibacteria group bacterium]|nr:alpha/beta hydrolase [Patescibacteria group bacterium]MDL1952768.1 hypothetical protein [Candidatus Uhrbacteria bacterium UHB]RIL01004.1 MAG: hypothetical protein DCC77_00485 [Candidatus Uhrbacteria bacterium]
MHAILVHGWKGWPENAWFPWLRRELESRGWTTEALKLPNPVLPRRASWVSKIRASIRGGDTVLIGHSLGCLAILQALSGQDAPTVQRVICVSGFGRPFLRLLQNGKTKQEWLPTDLDFDAIKAHADSWAVVHAHRDPLVPFAEGEWLAEQFGVQLIVPGRTGHLIHEEKAFEVPEILNAVTADL